MSSSIEPFGDREEVKKDIRLGVCTTASFTFFSFVFAALGVIGDALNITLGLENMSWFLLAIFFVLFAHMPAMHSLILGLVARYHWLMGKQNRAVKLWKRAIEEGKRLDARPELARTYMEIGARFLEEKSRYKELNGISAKEYLEKAGTMFQEMDLQWDLNELDKIPTSN